MLRAVVLLGLGIVVCFVADLFLLSLIPQSAGFVGRVVNGGMPAAKAGVATVVILSCMTFVAFCYAGWRLWSRPPRSLVISSLLVAAVLVADLTVMASVLPAMNRPLSDLGFVVALIGFIPMAVFAALRQLRSWRWMAATALALGLILAYLATDDPAINRPITFEQISPAFPGAEASYQVLMRYGKNHPLGKNFKEAKRIFDVGPFVDSSKPAEWPAWLTRHQAAVEADWAELAPVRAWIDELNGFERIGDLMPAQPDAEIITFSPFRSYTHHVCEIAGLQAIAGKGDEAIATLLPLIQVSRKLEPSSRSLVRAMVARVMQGIAQSTARFVLDTAKVSPAMRERLAAALAPGNGGEAGVRHLLAIEHVFFVKPGARGALGDFIPTETGRSEFSRRLLNLTSPFLYNPCRTANLHGEFVAHLQDAAARRDLKEFDRLQASFFRIQARPGFKNFMGCYLLSVMVPAYTKVVNAYWRIEDSRTALLARLARP